MKPANTLTHAALAAAAALVLARASTAYASDDATVEGTVVDLANGQPIGNAIAVDIACGTAHQHARVDGAGHFSFARLPDGACTLTLSGDGYESSAAGVTAASGSIKTVLLRIATTAYAAKQRELRDEGARRYREQPPMPAAPAPAVAFAPAHDAPPRAAQPPVQPVRLDPVGRGVGARHHIANQERLGGKELAVQQDADGYAAVRVFPVPQYTRAFDGPRTDFRETIYWNGDVETDANGNADVTFAASDAVTAFRATAEGFAANGTPGRGETTFQAKLPLTLDAHLPTEVTAGDIVRLPVTLANDTDDPITPTLSAQFGSAFQLVSQAPATLHLAARSTQTVVFALEVVATAGDSDVDLSATALGLTDEIKRTVRVVPRGFPIDVAASGTARRGTPTRNVVDLAGALPGSIHATVTMYPSPVAMMTDGMAGMIREPGGCFEQTSSSNYPNVMVLSYLESNDAADPALVEKTRGVLDKGYKLLTGYETPEKGYEWFGHTPGHEALTAYGLMEFADMSKVYDVDRTMVERTASWLMSRRDHHGGFARSSEALDSFGRADAAVTDAYIMWALAEAKRTSELTEELAAQRRLGLDTRDPYLLALAANTALLTAANATDSRAMVDRLIGLQSKDGSFPGARQTITMSGGESSTIETTALAAIALIHASPNGEHENQLRAAVDWLNGKRRSFGQWSNTQATILGLKAMAAYADHTRVTTAAGTATLVVNGVDAGAIRFEAGRRDALVWNDLAGRLSAGTNTLEVRLDSTTALPYAIAIDYRSAQPASSPRTKVAVTTELLGTTRVKMGDGVTLRAHVENTTQAGVPMTLARLGLPGGTVFQTWQLQELRDKRIIDYYETRPREVILYWRALAPGAKKDVDVKLLAAVPGTYEGPASSAYLYYTAEDKAWTAPLALTIE
jgi:uncharacterized protein YfaS (alpha-2-macroglobulin family)